MTPEHDQPTQAWLDELDAIVAGRDTPLLKNDELLQLAERLATGLKPLQGMDAAAEQRRQRLLRRLRARPARQRSSACIACVLGCWWRPCWWRC